MRHATKYNWSLYTVWIAPKPTGANLVNCTWIVIRHGDNNLRFVTFFLLAFTLFSPEFCRFDSICGLRRFLGTIRSMDSTINGDYEWMEWRTWSDTSLMTLAVDGSKCDNDILLFNATICSPEKRKENDTLLIFLAPSGAVFCKGSIWSEFISPTHTRPTNAQEFSNGYHVYAHNHVSLPQILNHSDRDGMQTTSFTRWMAAAIAKHKDCRRR